MGRNFLIYGVIHVETDLGMIKPLMGRVDLSTCIVLISCWLCHYKAFIICHQVWFNLNGTSMKLKGSSTQIRSHDNQCTFLEFYSLNMPYSIYHILLFFFLALEKKLMQKNLFPALQLASSAEEVHIQKPNILVASSFKDLKRYRYTGILHKFYASGKWYHSVHLQNNT